jgi:hypothetical protein
LLVLLYPRPFNHILCFETQSCFGKFIPEFLVIPRFLQGNKGTRDE